MRKLRWTVIAAATGLVALGAHLSVLVLTGNLHEVLPGELYRAAQVTPVQIAAEQADHGIRSILNLRGASPGESWYDAEVAESAMLGITHVDFAMSARHRLSVHDSERLVALMRDMPKPILIHCRHGSDRTGLASALHLGAIHGVGEEEAEGQLSLAYGHFSVPYLSAAYPMDENWEAIEPILFPAGT